MPFAFGAFAFGRLLLFFVSFCFHYTFNGYLASLTAIILSLHLLHHHLLRVDSDTQQSFIYKKILMRDHPIIIIITIIKSILNILWHARNVEGDAKKSNECKINGRSSFFACYGWCLYARNVHIITDQRLNMIATFDQNFRKRLSWGNKSNQKKKIWYDLRC